MGKNAEAEARAEKLAVIESHWAYKTKYLKIRHDIVKLPGKEPHLWDIVVHPGAVAVLPIDNQKRIVLVEQYRRAIDKITLELPAGLIDPGETVEECAQRELQEEAGFRAGHLKPLGAFYSSPGVFTEYVHLFLATDLIPSRLHADDTDCIDVRAVSLQEAMTMIQDGRICDAKTALGILRYQHV
jgi:ADP-ribose pyrophosphatase